MEANLLARLVETEAVYRIVMPDCRHIFHNRDRMEQTLCKPLKFFVRQALALYHDSMEFLKSLGLHQDVEAIEREADFMHCSTALMFREKTCDVVPRIHSALVYRIWRHLETVESFPKLEEVTNANTWHADMLGSVSMLAKELQGAYGVTDPTATELREFMSKCMLRVMPELEHIEDHPSQMTATVQDLGWCRTAHLCVGWVDTNGSMNISQHLDDIHMLAVHEPETTYVVPYVLRTDEDHACYQQLQKRNLFPSNWIGIPINE